MKRILCIFLACAGLARAEERPPNILFLAADDLRPQFGCYGRDEMITPHVDALAARGMVFEHAYCQAAVCRATRASLMLGLRPDRHRVPCRRAEGSNGSRHQHFRDHLPDIVTLPQQFMRHGYHAQSFGKIFHGAFKVRDKWNDPASWSEPAWFPEPRYYYTDEGVRVAREVFARKNNAEGAAVDD